MKRNILDNANMSQVQDFLSYQVVPNKNFWYIRQSYVYNL